MNAVAVKPLAASKPWVAALAAGCIALPASTGAAAVVEGRPFHLLPPELSVTAPVELTAFSYAGLFNLATAIGNAAFAGLDVVFLPLSLGFLVANLQSGGIPAYLKGFDAALTGAIPGLEAALTALFGGGLLPASVASTATAAPVTHTAAVTPALTPAVTPAASLGSIYTYFFNLAVATGNVAAAGLGVVLLPLSVGFLLLNNQSSAIPAYVKSVFALVPASITGFFDALFAFGGILPAAVKTAAVTSTATPKATSLVTLSTAHTVTPATVSSAVTGATVTKSSTKLAGTKKTTSSKHAKKSTNSGSSDSKAGKSK